MKLFSFQFHILRSLTLWENGMTWMLLWVLSWHRITPGMGLELDILEELLVLLSVLFS